MSNPDHIGCIKFNETDESWCGRHIKSEWAFQDIDHAAISGDNRNRPVVCKHCFGAVVIALSNGIDPRNTGGRW